MNENRYTVTLMAHEVLHHKKERRTSFSFQRIKKLSRPTTREHSIYLECLLRRIILPIYCTSNTHVSLSYLTSRYPQHVQNLLPSICYPATLIE